MTLALFPIVPDYTTTKNKDRLALSAIARYHVFQMISCDNSEIHSNAQNGYQPRSR
jgi:hypothetical protein